MSALRRAAWNPRMTVVDRAFTRKGINPETGRQCKFHRCEACQLEFPRGKMKADHQEPVIPLDHNWKDSPSNFLGYDWNEVMRRLWIEKGDGWNVVCEGCHNLKSDEEKKQRRLAKLELEKEEELS